MAVEIYLPKMSDHMETGKIIRWLFKEGDQVEAGQVLLELETDKAVGEIEAPATGVLKSIRAADGEEVPVGETLAYIARADENVPHLKPFASGKQEVETQTPEPATADLEPALSESGIVPATPVARKVAKELGIDLKKVKGSGPGGRVKEEDVRAYAESLTLAASQPAPGSTPPAVPAAPAVPKIEPQPVAAKAVPATNGQSLELTTIQRITGQRMLESVTTAPHFFLQINVDMSRALTLVESASQRSLASGGDKVSITAVLVRVAAAALKKFPRVNATFADGALRGFSQINVGVAVGTENGLAVPVIHNADQKDLAEINRDLKIFQSKGKEMRFSTGDLEGGTFTISNLGMYGVDVFNAIINPPQSAILAAGRTVKTPIALEDDSVVVRPMMTLTLSVDHRALDGIQGAQFLAEIKTLLEDPQLLI